MIFIELMMSKFFQSFLTGVFSKEINEKGLRVASGILGYAFFTAFFVITWVYYKERMIPFDGAFQCFKLIDAQWFNIEAGRFGVIVTQILPLLALKVGASLENILRLYSISFVAVQFIVFLILYYKLQDYRAVLALLLALCLAYRYQFYYSVSEIHQTIAPLVLVFALLNAPLVSSLSIKDRRTFVALFIVVCLWLSNIHILSLVLLTFIVVYAVMNKKELLSLPYFWVSLVGGYSFYAYKILTVEEGSYQASKMISADKIKTTITNLSDIPAFQFFKEEFFRSYYILVFAALLLSAIYIYRKNWLPFFYVLLSCIGFFILIISYNIVHDSPIVYQNYYACFGLLIAVPLVIELVKLFKVKIVFAVVALLLLFSTIKIIKCSLMYEMRMEYFSRIEQNVKDMPERKFMIHSSNVDWNMIWTEWDMGFETLMHSAIASPDSAISFTIANNYSDYDSMMYKPNTLIGVLFSPYWFTSDNLPQRYFPLQNTPYRILNKIPADSNANGKIKATELELDFAASNASGLPYFSYHIIPLIIRNKSNDTLYSRSNDADYIGLGYRLYDDQNKLLDTRNTYPLEMDVYPRAARFTGLELKHVKRGKYVLEVDFIYGHEKWLNRSKRYAFEVY
ncbi:MAG: hypothetical protein K0R51_2346 [Cytophagaceae bacterium]|jgi:hypothetical protein|nr:hypothetical protein [Cytophagaceae bacterium]